MGCTRLTTRGLARATLTKCNAGWWVSTKTAVECQLDAWAVQLRIEAYCNGARAVTHLHQIDQLSFVERSKAWIEKYRPRFTAHDCDRRYTTRGQAGAYDERSGKTCTGLAKLQMSAAEAQFFRYPSDIGGQQRMGCGGMSQQNANLTEIQLRLLNSQSNGARSEFRSRIVWARHLQRLVKGSDHMALRDIQALGNSQCERWSALRKMPPCFRQKCRGADRCARQHAAGPQHRQSGMQHDRVTVHGEPRLPSGSNQLATLRKPVHVPEAAGKIRCGLRH